MSLVEIYSRDTCGACQNAKKMLSEKNVPYVEYKVDVDITRDDLLKKFPNARSLPVIIFNGKQITEVTDFQLLLEKDERPCL